MKQSCPPPAEPGMLRHGAHHLFQTSAARLIKSSHQRLPWRRSGPGVHFLSALTWTQCGLSVS
eukprot:364327-Chlamydomonas_euryale.AAC.2